MDLGNPLIWITALAFLFFKATQAVAIDPSGIKRKYDNAVDRGGGYVVARWAATVTTQSY